MEQLLTSKGLFGFGKKKKSPVGFERVVKLLAGEKARDWQRTPGRKEYKAPEPVSTVHVYTIETSKIQNPLPTQQS